MAVKIRLKRMGRKKDPFYRMVVADERAPRDGRYIEELGYYNPLTKDLKLDNVKAADWIRKGAQPTETARALLKKSGAFDQKDGGPAAPADAELVETEVVETAAAE